jgi:hypothetical protein
MKKQLNEQFRRMQKLAGILNESMEDEGGNQKPNTITLAFNGRSGYNSFLGQYFNKIGREGGHTSMVYQADGFASNWTSLQGNGHPTVGEDGLIMESGIYYPLFTTTENIGGEWTNSDWIFICYFKENNEVFIIQSNEYSGIGKGIERKITKRPRGPQIYCKFDKIEAGQTDHIGYFEIVSVK